MGKRLIAFWAMMALLAWAQAAHGARIITVAQSPAPGTQFDMGSTQSLTFLITNASTGGQAGERVYEVRFRINSGSVFAAGTGAPAGWTLSAFSATSITFSASSWASAIAVGGGPRSFTLAITMRTAAADVNDRLRDIRAQFTNTTTGPPFTSRGTDSIGTPGDWAVVSLEITSFQITDTAGTPVTAITAGSSFRLVMTIRNNSSATQTNISSNPDPPTAVKTGTVTQVLSGTAGSPLALVTGASGTITFTYGTAVTDIGTIQFTAQAWRSATVKSRVTTSTALSLGRFTASLAVSPTCQYAGSNITVTMTLTVAYPYQILNVTPVVSPVAGAPVTLLAGPTPAAPILAIPPSPPTLDVTWTYRVNATGTTNPFTFSGSASGTANTAGSPAVSTPAVTSGNITRGSFTAAINPAVVNAGSGNVELTASIANNGCAAVDSVVMTAPAGWSAAADVYSLVNLGAGSAIETWTGGGANPVLFTAPDPAGRMPLGSGGDFAAVYGSTPPNPVVSIFNLRVTDANGLSADIPVNVLVNAFKSGTLNDARSGTWREDFR